MQREHATENTRSTPQHEKKLENTSELETVSVAPMQDPGWLDEMRATHLEYINQAIETIDQAIENNNTIKISHLRQMERAEQGIVDQREAKTAKLNCETSLAEGDTSLLN